MSQLTGSYMLVDIRGNPLTPAWFTIFKASFWFAPPPPHVAGIDISTYISVHDLLILHAFQQDVPFSQ